ncbi:DUF305 domain-containing protein [Paracoccus sp. SM22M-07]|uniref:DUF305 domain-containing protein n=1 Tax=Paracoccus sp. SM22M-07 TaxID=1520813 RepID=UPI00091174C6|nr:DUF305 domain-containing protein [Paracoccus sp. SM22M-07]OJH45711.1 hypothetical protein IE00_00125 [Paracoccus sp. SM22M-07]
MSYARFALMIATSTIVMFGLMYLNTYASEHVFFSETRVYMAIMMGAVMAIVMLAFMLGMYEKTRLNIVIFAGAAIVFAGSLWLVRSQTTISGVSYMGAMIPHHSIAIMTSERAGIEDPRVKKLAMEIRDAQQREIAEMRYLIADAGTADAVHQDPPAKAGTVQDALSNTLISQLDPATVTQSEAEQILGKDPECAFRRTAEGDPILWTPQDSDRATMKLNGVLLSLGSSGEADSAMTFAAQGIRVDIRPLGNDASWRADAELVFRLEHGLTIGYRGFYDCGQT